MDTKPYNFTLPDTPRSDWEIFRWVIYEPSQILRFCASLRSVEIFLFFLRVYFKIVLPITISTYILGGIVIALLDLIYVYPNWFIADIVLAWSENIVLHEKLIVYYEITGLNFLFGLLYGTSISLGVIGVSFFVPNKQYFLAASIAASLAFGLIAGLFAGLPEKFAYASLIAGNLPTRAAIGLALGLVVGLFPAKWNFTLTQAFFFSLLFGITYSLAGGFVFLLKGGTERAVVSVLTYSIGAYRLWQYPYYLLRYFRNSDFSNNPYLQNETIWKVSWIDSALIKAAIKDPKQAIAFANFLLEFRNLQRPLAVLLIHTSVATLWKSATIIKSTDLDILKLPPQNDSRLYKYRPSDEWRKQLKIVKRNLVYFEGARQNKRERLDACMEAVNDLIQVTLLETFEGRDDYLSAFNHWLLQLQEEKTKLKATEKITINPYSKGAALSPAIKSNKTIFLGRDDIKDALAQKILNSPSLPMLFLQAQRRVGKTSLLKFLPNLLGFRFKVVVQDFDTLSGGTLIEWLKDLHSKVQIAFEQAETPAWQPPNNPLDAWTELAAYLKTLTEKDNQYLILAFDEYEKFHHTILAKQPGDIAQNLLWRLRGFLQDQHRVVFLFTGADSFSDLKNPDWSKVFVHQHVFHIDYLSEESAMKLIEHPIPEFKLRYEDGLAAHIYQLTQGHPHLIHAICSDLTDHANQHTKNPVTFQDLEKILKENTLIMTPPFDVFWDEFCREREMKKTVMDIVNGKPLEKNRHIVRLLIQKYITEQNGIYKMRVPLFEDWLKIYGTVD